MTRLLPLKLGRYPDLSAFGSVTALSISSFGIAISLFDKAVEPLRIGFIRVFQSFAGRAVGLFGFGLPFALCW